MNAKVKRTNFEEGELDFDGIDFELPEMPKWRGLVNTWLYQLEA